MGNVMVRDAFEKEADIQKESRRLSEWPLRTLSVMRIAAGQSFPGSDGRGRCLHGHWRERTSRVEVDSKCTDIFNLFTEVRRAN